MKVAKQTHGDPERQFPKGLQAFSVNASDFTFTGYCSALQPQKCVNERDCFDGTLFVDTAICSEHN